MTASSTPPAELTPAQIALAAEILSVEHHVAKGGWDEPIRVFALVHTARALRDTPEIVSEIPPEAVELSKVDPFALLAIEQEDLPQSPNLETLLAQLAWPDSVDGVAVSVEQFVVPPEAQADLPDNPAQQVQALMDHPDRDDVRIVAGVLRTGESWCALRYRSHDEDEKVAQSSTAVPGLLEALRATFE